MNFSAYSDLWALPGVRQAVILGALGKAPWFGATFVLTLHVVRELGYSYASAGILTAVFTLATAIASPCADACSTESGCAAPCCRVC